MADYNLGTARGRIELDASQVDSGVKDAQTSIQNLQSDLLNSRGALSTIGDSLDTLGEKIVSTFSTAAKVVGVAAGAITGYSLWGGLQRVLDTEDARKLFGQMGSGAEEVDNILSGLNSTFEKSSFSYPDVYNVAAQLQASGTAIDDLNDQTKTVGDLAAFSGTEFGRVGELITRIGAQGKVSGRELQSMASMGIPMRQILADGLEVSVSEINDMISAGEVTSDMFHDIVGDTDMVAGSMETMADTTRGAWETIKAGVAGAGQALLQPWFGENGDMVSFLKGISDVIFQQVQPALEDFGQWLYTVGQEFIQDTLVPALELLTDIFQNKIVPAVQAAREWFDKNRDTIQKLLEAMGPAASIIAAVATSIHLLRTAMVLLQAATPIGLLFLLVSALVYAWQNSETFRTIVTNAFNAIKEVVGIVVETLVGWFEVVRGWFGSTGDSASGFSEKVRLAWQAIQEFIAPIIAWFQEHVGPVFTAFGELFSAIWEKVRSNFSLAWAAISTIISEGMTFFQQVWNQIGEPVTTIFMAAWEHVKDTFNTIWTILRTTVETALGAIRGIIQVVTGIISGDWDKVWSGIRTVLSSLWTGMRTIVTTAINFIRGTISRVMNTIRSLWSSGWTKIRLFVTTAWSKIREGISRGIRLAVALIRGLPRRMLSALGNIGSYLLESGKSLLRGFARGITQGFTNARQAVTDGLSRLRNFLPFSPAKEGPFSGKGWTLYSGKSIIEGLAKGMKDQERELMRTALGVADNVSGALSMPAMATAQTRSGFARSGGLSPGNGGRPNVSTSQQVVIENIQALDPREAAQIADSELGWSFRTMAR